VSPESESPTPRPGSPVRGSKTGQPLNALFDLLGRRWTLTVLWTLRAEAMTFRELQSAAGGVAASVLNTRLRELREAGLIGNDDGYALTDLGRQLLEAGGPLIAWAVHWAAALEEQAAPPAAQDDAAA
jgi:DNA-binding HxlR family transcriptional regulator